MLAGKREVMREHFVAQINQYPPEVRPIVK